MSVVQKISLDLFAYFSPPWIAASKNILIIIIILQSSVS